jgi:hypothetical protein
MGNDMRSGSVNNISSQQVVQPTSQHLPPNQPLPPPVAGGINASRLHMPSAASQQSATFNLLQQRQRWGFSQGLPKPGAVTLNREEYATLQNNHLGLTEWQLNQIIFTLSLPMLAIIKDDQYFALNLHGFQNMANKEINRRRELSQMQSNVSESIQASSEEATVPLTTPVPEGATATAIVEEGESSMHNLYDDTYRQVFGMLRPKLEEGEISYVDIDKPVTTSRISARVGETAIQNPSEVNAISLSNQGMDLTGDGNEPPTKRREL